jgi:hypothetical protein
MNPRHEYVFCDESCQTEQFLVVGALAVPEHCRVALQNRMMSWRARENMNAELKWTKVSKSRLPEYQSLVDLAFDEIRRRRLSFSAIVVDRSVVDYKRFHRGDRDLGLYKFYYLLLLHKVCRRMARGSRLDIFVDQKLSRFSLETLRTYLNVAARRYAHEPGLVARVEPIDSKTCCMIQIADVLMGAIGYHCNRHALIPGAGQPKITLAGRIARSARLVSLAHETRYGATGFVIWHWRPAERESAPAPRPKSGDPQGVSAS